MSRYFREKKKPENESLYSKILKGPQAALSTAAKFLGIGTSLQGLIPQVEHLLHQEISELSMEARSYLEWNVNRFSEKGYIKLFTYTHFPPNLWSDPRYRGDVSSTVILSEDQFVLGELMHMRLAWDGKVLSETGMVVLRTLREKEGYLSTSNYEQPDFADYPWQDYLRVPGKSNLEIEGIHMQRVHLVAQRSIVKRWIFPEIEPFIIESSNRQMNYLLEMGHFEEAGREEIEKMKNGNSGNG